MQHRIERAVESKTQTYLIDCVAPLESGDIIIVPYQVDATIFVVQLGAWQSRNITSISRTGFQLVTGL